MVLPVLCSEAVLRNSVIQKDICLLELKDLIGDILVELKISQSTLTQVCARAHLFGFYNSINRRIFLCEKEIQRGAKDVFESFSRAHGQA